MARYVIREYGQEAIFRRPAIGKALHLPRSSNVIPTARENDFVFLFTRSFSKYPLFHGIFLLCLLGLSNTLPTEIVKSLQFVIHDPERYANLLPTWYSMREGHFLDANVKIVLHDRVFLSIAWITTANSKV